MLSFSRGLKIPPLSNLPTRCVAETSYTTVTQIYIPHSYLVKMVIKQTKNWYPLIAYSCVPSTTTQNIFQNEAPLILFSPSKIILHPNIFRCFLNLSTIFTKLFLLLLLFLQYLYLKIPRYCSYIPFNSFSNKNMRYYGSPYNSQT